MAINLWRGDADAAAQVTTVTPANVEIGDTFRLACNGKTVEYVAVEASADDVASGLAAAIAASAAPEWAEIDASAAGGVLTLTAAVAGVPFAVTAGTSETSSGKITVAESVQGVSPVNEMQQVTITSDSTGGTFTLSADFGSGAETTAGIAWNASAAAVQSALEALASIDAGDVLVTGANGGPWFVQFQGAFAAADAPLLAMDGSSLTGTNSIDVATTRRGLGTTDEVQSVAILASGGTYRLTFAGYTTGALAYNATAAQVQAALENLPSIGAGNCVVTGVRSHFWVRFVGSLSAANLPLLVPDDSGLTGDQAWVFINGAANGGNIIYYNHGYRDGGQSISNALQLFWLGSDSVQPTGGTYRLGFGGYWTAPIPWDAFGTTITNALMALPSIGSGNVESVVSLAPYLAFPIAFKGALAGIDLALVEVNDSGVTYSNSATGGHATLIEGHPGGALVNEIQTVAVNGSTGTFTLSFGGQATAAIAVGAAASAVETALEALSTIDAVAVTGSGTPAAPYSVEFQGTLAGRDVAQLTADASSVGGGAGLAVTVTEASAGVDEQQTVTLDASVTGGTFTLAFQGATTAALASSASAAAVQSALQALATIGSSNATVAGADGGPWTVTFAGALAKTDVPLMVADGTNLDTGDGSQTLALSLSTRSRGPNHWDDPANWTLGRLPGSGDAAVLETGSEGPLYGLRQRSTFTADASTDRLTLVAGGDFRDGQLVQVRTTGTLPGGLSAATNYEVAEWDHGGQTCRLKAVGGALIDLTTAGTGTHTVEVVLAQLKQHNRCRGQLGLPLRNENGYYEYRPRHLRIGLAAPATADDENLIFGAGEGSGSPRLHLDCGESQLAGTVLSTGGSPDAGVPACQILVSHAAAKLTVLEGEVGVAFDAGETSQLKRLVQRGGTVSLGDVQLAELDRTGGALFAEAATLAGTLTLR